MVLLYLCTFTNAPLLCKLLYYLFTLLVLFLGQEWLQCIKVGLTCGCNSRNWCSRKAWLEVNGRNLAAVDVTFFLVTSQTSVNAAWS